MTNPFGFTLATPVAAMNEEDFERFAEDRVFDAKTVGFLQKRYSVLLQKAVDGARYLGRMSAESPAYRCAWMVWMIECRCPNKEYFELFEYLRKRGIMQHTDADLATAWGTKRYMNMKPSDVIGGTAADFVTG